MELRHIRYFLAVAEEGNFTRAAERMGIAQPPLSMQIKSLEEELGAKLFHRLPGGTLLTEAGCAFFERVRDIPREAQEAVLAAQRAQRGEAGRLCVGLTGTASFNPEVIACIREFRRSFPEVELKIDEANSGLLIEGLLEKRLDVALLRPQVAAPDGVLLHNVLDEPLVVALPEAHPMAAREGVGLADLQHEPLILPPLSVGKSLHEAVLNTYREVRLEPRLGPPATQIASILSLVSAELGIALVPESIAQLRIAGVRFVRLLSPPATITLAIALPDRRPLRTAVNFHNIVRTVCAGPGAGA